MPAANLREEARLLTQWLLKNPVDAEIIGWLAVHGEQDTDAERLHLDRARTYLDSTKTIWCSTCWEAILWFPDGRSLLWPSLHPHRCSPLDPPEQRKQSPAKPAPAPSEAPARGGFKRTLNV